MPGEDRARPELARVLDALGASTVTAVRGLDVRAGRRRASCSGRHFGVHSLEGLRLRGQRPPASGAAGAVLHYVTRRAAARRRARAPAAACGSPSDFLLLDEATCREPRAGVLPRRAAHRGGHDAARGAGRDRDGHGQPPAARWLLRPLARPRASGRGTTPWRRSAPTARCCAGCGRRWVARARPRTPDRPPRRGRRQRAGPARGGANRWRALPGVRRRVEGHRAARLAALAGSLEPAAGPGRAASTARSSTSRPRRCARAGSSGRATTRSWTSCGTRRRKAAAGWREFQAAEQERTGIKSLKVRHNKVFGYYIEVTKAQPGRGARRTTSASRRS